MDRKILLLCIILLVQVVSVDAYFKTFVRYLLNKFFPEIEDKWPPSFCHNSICPRFEVKENTDFYELRRYNDSVWISVMMEGMEFADAIDEGRSVLHTYFDGENSFRQAIDKTVPLNVMFHHGRGPVESLNYVISFFLPSNFHQITPEPLDVRLKITKLSSFQTYVFTFQEDADLVDVQEQATKLMDYLMSKGLAETYRSDMYYFNEYEGFLGLFRPHNEIWFIKKSPQGHAVRCQAFYCYITI